MRITETQIQDLVKEIIRKVGKKKWAIYSKKKKKGRRKRLGTFGSKKSAKKREKQINYSLLKDHIQLRKLRGNLILKQRKTSVSPAHQPS